MDEERSDSISRRSAIIGSAQALSMLLICAGSPSYSNGSYGSSFPPGPCTIVVTGCNSGIGYDAVKRMAERGHTIIMACRLMEKATDAANKIRQELADLKFNLVPKECDLIDLKSIDAFVEDLKRDGLKIDALCLNAGVARNTAAKDILRTKQGFELTIGTNHLGHFYLQNKLFPLMAQKSRIVVTASGVHDPESPGGAQGSKATLGNLKGLEDAVDRGDGVFDMIDGGTFDADKAYKDSKLCNVLYARELQKRLDMLPEKDIKVNCFNPGLIVSTGLFRDQNKLFTKVFDFAATDLLKVGETVHWGGGALEYMTLDTTVGAKGGLFYSSDPGSSKFLDDAFGNQFKESKISYEASDDAKARRLWELSEKLVGLA
jgi:protochlorophyllide reductase